MASLSRRDWALVLGLPALAYLPVLWGTFNFDDVATILLNPEMGRWAGAFLESFDRAHPLSGAEMARAIIDQRYNERLGVEMLARMTGCHSVRLQASFKQLFGLSLREYRTRVRVLRAATLAATSDAKIDAIAATVGFRSRRHFYNAFHRVAGCTPSEMRKCPPEQLERALCGFPAQ